MPYEIIIGRNETDRKRFGDTGTVLLGRHYVTMGKVKSLSSPVYLDAVRPHVILVAGKRGCLPGDHKVFTSRGYIEIKDFDEKQDKIYSYNKKTNTFKWEQARLLKYPLKESLFKFELYDGQSIIATDEHPLLVLNKGHVHWKKAENITKGDLIIGVTNVPEVKNDKESCRIARLLGSLLSDGTMNIRKGRWKDGRGYWYNGNKSRLRIFNGEEEVLAAAKSDLEEEFGVYVKRYKRNDCNCEVIETRYRKVIEKFKSLGVPLGKKSKIIRVPQIVWSSSNKFKTNFIKALFSCDGYISKDGSEIDYYSNSKLFLFDLHLLLTHFQIQSTIRKKKVKLNNKEFISYILYITDHTSLENFKRIGFLSKNKNERLMKHKFYRVKRRKGVAYLDDNLFTLKINKISKVNGIKKVYDLQVPENHSFIANGIISHNSGKSYSLGVIAEGMAGLPAEISKNIACLIFDTMGIYWTMKYPNYRDDALLKEWKLAPRALNPVIFCPAGLFNDYQEKGIPVDVPFAIRPADVGAREWCTIFGIELTSAEGTLIERSLGAAKAKHGDKFSVDQIIECIQTDARSSPRERNVVENRFVAVEKWGIFSESGTALDQLIVGGQTTVLDLSAYAQIEGGDLIKALVIGFLSKKILETRLLARKGEEVKLISEGGYLAGEVSALAEQKAPLVWIMVDECLPYSAEVITDKAHTKIGELVARINNGEKVKVLGYDSKTKEYKHYNITKAYKIAKRALITLITETGRELRCTPDHLILTKRGFISAIDAAEIATPVLYHHSKNKKLITARLAGAIFGDGYLSKNKVVGFSGKGNEKDLVKIKQDLEELGFSSGSISSRITHSKIVDGSGKEVKVKGLSQEVRASRKAHAYFLETGCPVGKKTNSKFVVPAWLLKASKDEKAEFLAALMGGDGYSLSPAKKVPSDFNPLRLSFNKSMALEKNAWKYACQLKQLFEDLGVKVSQISRGAGNIRKDGTKTFKIVLTLAKGIDNTIRFLEKVGYRYCEEKEIEGNKWLAYLKARKSLLSKRKELCSKALELHKKGLGKIRIGRKLSIPAYQAREWIYFKGGVGLPKSFPIFDDWISKRYTDEVIYEKVISKENAGEEELYDISVDKVHNFVANGCIVHNCHEFLPHEGSTLASYPLIQLLREGRQPGISLVLATQQPGKIHTDVMTQSDIVISHRLTAKLDIGALNEIMQTYLAFDLDRYIDDLPRVKGAGIVLDDNSEKVYPLRIRPRFSWHGGEDPAAIRGEMHRFGLHI